MEEGRLLLYTWIGGLHRITGLLLVGFIACCIWARKVLLLVGFSKIVSSIGGAFGVNIAVDCCARSTDFSVRSQRTVFFVQQFTQSSVLHATSGKRSQVV
jgi:hypothetical protein